MLRAHRAAVVIDRPPTPLRAAVGGACTASASMTRAGGGVASRASHRPRPGPRPSGGGRARARAADAAAASSSPSADTDSPARLVLYTKPGCCLCEGLKERLDEVLVSDAMLASAPALVGASLELRDVSTNEEWATKHAMEVPVLRLLDDDGGDGGEREIPLPRPAPRLSAARLAIRLGQDVDAARGGDGGSSRKGWSVSAGGGAGIGAAGAAPSSASSSGGGWSVVSDKGW